MPTDIDHHIETLNAHIEIWELRFQRDPDLKQAYLALGKRIMEYLNCYGYSPKTALEERMEKTGGIVRMFPPSKLKDPGLVKPEQYEDLMIDLEYHFLVRQAIDDGVYFNKFPQIKKALKRAVATAVAIRQEYDDILLNKLIKQQLKNDTAGMSVFDIPYDRLEAFNQAAMKYL